MKNKFFKLDFAPFGFEKPEFRQSRNRHKNPRAAERNDHKMKIAVTGANGQLGRDVRRCCEALGDTVFCADLPEQDILDAAQTRQFLADCRPQALIHCAAYTQVDQAEEEKEKCFAVNAQGTKNVAEACAAVGARLLYVSTDYVFDGSGDVPRTPQDTPNPLNVYGESKLAGERAVLTLCPQSLVVRTSWLFGGTASNFVRTMLRLAETNDEIRVVNDQFGSPTYTPDLAQALRALAAQARCGIVHVTNEGFCSWAEFAAEIFRLAGASAKVKPIPSAEYPTPARRPRNSRLAKNAAEAPVLPSWQDALARCLSE